MFKRKKKTGCETPKYRKPTVPLQSTVPPMPPTTGSNAFKPNPNYIPPSTVKTACTYSTPCGWCAKWDKKCDKKIGRKKDKDLEDIKSGKGLTRTCIFREPWKSIVP